MNAHSQLALARMLRNEVLLYIQNAGECTVHSVAGEFGITNRMVKQIV